MSQPNEQPAPCYVTCQCQHCDGHIEFDAHEFAEENSIVPCPHCGLETKIFMPILQTENVPIELPSSVVSPNTVKRDGFFCGEVVIQESETGAGGEPMPVQVVAALSTDQRAQAPITNEKQNSPLISKKEIPVPNYWRKKLQEKNATGKSTSSRIALTSAQCKIPIVQELIALLIEIEKDGFITDSGALVLREWLEVKYNSEIPAFYFLLDTARVVLAQGKLTTRTLSEIQNALELQVAIERVLPKHIREPIIAKRIEVEERLRNNAPASQGVLDRIRELGGKPQPGISAAEAYELKEKLYHQPTEKQLEYIRALGVNPPPDLTRYTAIDLIDKLLHSTKATERQLQYIRDLGGNPPAGLNHADAGEIIKQLLARQQSTPRQMMILRFWNKTDLMQSSKDEVVAWLEQFYSDDPRRKQAWELFKLESGDDGSQHDPSCVPLGAGESYLSKLS